MLPELFRIFGFPIFSFGVMLIIGFLLASQLAKYLSRRVGIDPEVMVNAGLLALISGVVGARLSHVLENWSDYTSGAFVENIKAAANIADGGLTFYGGLILALPVCIAYGLYKQVSIRRGMDIVAPCLMVGLALGRVGCFFNGCCYGHEVAWGVQFPYGSPAYVEQYLDGKLPERPPSELLGERGHLLDRRDVAHRPALKSVAQHHDAAPVHPTQLYSTFNSLMVAGMLVAYFTFLPPPGRVFALMLMLEGLTRFLLEMLRVEPAVVGAGTGTLGFLPPMSYSMVIGLLLIPAGAILWMVAGKYAPRGDERPPAPTAATAT